MREEFLRTAGLIGNDALNRLNKAAVAVFGIGGVGSYALEALVRSGIGTISIYDNDTVSKSNINRQLIALQSTVGEYKTGVAMRRCLDINPDVRITENRVFVTPQTEIPFADFDYIIDAVDNITAKLHIICGAATAGVPVVSVMGTGNKLDPTLVRVSDIYETYECPLARVMRTELRKRGIVSLKAVWSPERAAKPMDMGEHRENGRVCPASMTMVPASAGIAAASVVIRELSRY